MPPLCLSPRFTHNQTWLCKFQKGWTVPALFRVTLMELVQCPAYSRHSINISREMKIFHPYCQLAFLFGSVYTFTNTIWESSFHSSLARVSLLLLLLANWQGEVAFHFCFNQLDINYFFLCSPLASKVFKSKGHLVFVTPAPSRVSVCSRL